MGATLPWNVAGPAVSPTACGTLVIYMAFMYSGSYKSMAACLFVQRSALWQLQIHKSTAWTDAHSHSQHRQELPTVMQGKHVSQFPLTVQVRQVHRNMGRGGQTRHPLAICCAVHGSFPDDSV